MDLITSFRNFKRRIQQIDETVRRNDASPIVLNEAEAFLRLRTGELLYVDPRDLSVAPWLMMGGEWEPQLTRHFLDAVQSTSTVLDLGANFGYFGIIAATKAAKGEVHLFEANSHLIPYLHKSRLVHSACAQIFVNHVAVAASSGAPITLRKPRYLLGSASVARGHQLVEELDPYVDEEEVGTRSVDDYCDEAGLLRVDVVKMDVESFEEEAFAGMERTIARSPGLVAFVEYTRGAYSSDFFPRLRSWFGSVEVLHPERGAVAVANEREAFEGLDVEPATLILRK